MKQMRKRILSMLCTGAIVLSGVPLLGIPAHAATVDSGTCGDNLTWTLDDSGTLTISGSGEMDDFYWENGDENYEPNITIPWYDNCEEIVAVVFDGNITSIGDFAFHFCSNLTSITMPDSVNRIGECVFVNCGLRRVTIPDGVTVLEQEVFEGCENLYSITIPSSVTSIEAFAFYNCRNLTDVFYAGSEEEWNAIDFVSEYGETFNDDLLNATIHYNYSPDAISYADLDGDSLITVNDASITLSYYAEAAIGGGGDISDEILAAADIDGDGVITVNDARYILIYYAETSIGGSPSWDDILTR